MALVGVFGVALAARWLYLLQASGHPLHGTPFVLLDSLHYHNQAQAILAGEWIGTTPYFLGPLYAHVLALIYALFGVSMSAVFAVQVLLAAATCALLADLATRVFDRRVGVLAGLGFALYGPHIFYTGHLLPTLTVVFLNLLLVWILVRDVDAPSPRRAIGAGVVLGLTILTKSNALLMLPGVLVAMAWWHRRMPLSRKLSWAAGFALATVLIVAPATLHNFIASGELVPVTTSTGRNLWKGNGPVANGTHPLGHWEDDRGGLGRRLQGLVNADEAVEGSSEYVARTVGYVSENPGATVRLIATKFVLFFNGVELGVRDQYYFAKERVAILRAPLLGFGLVAPIGVAGLLFGLRRLRRSWPLALLLGVQLASFLAVFVLARYRLVAAACLVAFAAAQIVAWVDAARSAEWRRIAASLAAAMLIAVFVNQSLADFPPERGYALQWERIGDQNRLAGEHAAALAAYEKALVGDWQDLDPKIKRAETRLRMARTRAAVGDFSGADELVREILEGATEQDARTRRLVLDAKLFSETLDRR